MVSVRPKVGKRSVDGLIIALAARSHGVVSRVVLHGAGVTEREIKTRVGDGRLQPLHRGVYLVGAVASEYAYPQAALLACGPDAVLSHWSAAAIWKLRPYPPQAHPCVTVPTAREIVRPRVVIRRTSLEGGDIRQRHRLALVSPPRAILDCAALLDDLYELEALVAEAHFRGLASEDEQRLQVERNAGRPGVSALRAVLDIEGGPQRTRSGGERWFLRLLRENGFRGFETNQIIYGKEVDFFWRNLNFCVELDGWGGHSSRIAFDRDRMKWAHLQANGITVMPLSVRAGQRDEGGTLDRLQRALARQ